MSKFKELRSGLAGHVIAGLIFLSVLEPLLHGLYSLLTSIGTEVTNSYINFIYKNAAIHGETQSLIFLMAMIFFQIVLMVMFFMVRDIHSKAKRVQAKEILEKATSIEEKRSLLLARLAKIEKSLSWIKRNIKSLVLVSYVLTALSFILLLHTFFLSYTTIQLNMSFDQRLTSIGPYLTDRQEKQLKSEWSLMATKHDFDIINVQLENIARVNKINLPINL